MLGANLFDTEDIYSNLTYLSTVGGKRYSKELISLGNKLYKDINKGYRSQIFEREVNDE